MSSGVLILVTIMLASLWFIIDIWKKNGTGFSLLIILLFIINISSTICILYYSNVIGSRADNLYKNEENHYLMSKSYVLGKYLADNYSGGRVLIIAEPDYKKNNDFKVLLEGFKKAFGNKITIGTIEGISVTRDTKPGERPPPLWRVMQAVDFDNVINNHPECNIVITTIGLPEDMHRMDLWLKPDKTRPKLAVMNGYIFTLWKALKEKYVVAATTGTPKKITDEPPPTDLEKTFARRYILVTKENIDEIMKMYPSMFFLQ